ncbi:DNA ligase [Ruminococcus callidus]|uniref:DNA ligase n=1 Tax=Ruminococcus callidus TaxID=40519 RepID=UPI0026ED2AB8|nr:DNA ligase [Ruminococcus callidus]MBS4831731.1 DNA ligase [Ruminococcus callidus]
MSKMSELSQVLDEMVSCGENLIQAAKALKDIFSSTEEEKKSVSLEDVRAVLAEKSRKGFTEEVKEIISKHGADRLSGIDPSEYESLLSEAEVIGNA